jgi:carbamoyl-phosphate synthase large subunit
MNVLITAASRRVALVKLFKNNPDINKVITVDCDPLSPAHQFSDGYSEVPKVKSKLYVRQIYNLCTMHNINVLIPTIDIELGKWAEKRDRLYNLIDLHVIVSDEKTIKICSDKLKTFEHFKRHKLPWFVNTFKLHNGDEIKLPMFMKPRVGRGSVYANEIREWEDYIYHSRKYHDLIGQDFLDGKEFSLDAYFSIKTNKLINFVPRWRHWVRAGVTDRGETFRDERFLEIMKKMEKIFKFRGVVNFQGKIADDGEIKFFEINPRYPGGIALSDTAGLCSVNYIYEELFNGSDLKWVTPMRYANELYMACYEDCAFLWE